MLCQVHAGLGEYEYAIEECRRYLRERQSDVKTRILVAQSLVNLGQTQAAIAELEAIPEDERTVEVYKRRNEIERLFRRLKGFRRIFSRFEKLDALFLGFIHFALICNAVR